MIDTVKYSEFTIPREDIATCVEFCHSETSSQLLAVGSNHQVSIYLCRFRDEEEEVEEFEYEHLYDFQNTCRVTAIAWSPDTTILTLPKHIRLAVAGSDHKIRIFTTDLKQDNTVKILEGHTSFINSLTFDPETGSQLASVGDDRLCRIWDRDGNQKTFPLGSPGVAICWHRDEPMKLMVAVKNGLIRIFSVNRDMQLMSLETRDGMSPLMDADWSLGNKGVLIGAVVDRDWVMYDLSESRPMETRRMHTDGCQYFRWARCHDSLVASVGRPGREIKIFNAKHQQMPLTISQPVTYSISWHQKLPVLAAGGDHKVHIYRLESV